MNRFIIALSVSAIVASALPAIAGPNGSTAPGYFPLQPKRPQATKKSPHALLGDTSEPSGSGWASRPATKGKLLTQTFQRRPSEGK